MDLMLVRQKHLPHLIQILLCRVIILEWVDVQSFRRNMVAMIIWDKFNDMKRYLGFGFLCTAILSGSLYGQPEKMVVNGGAIKLERLNNERIKASAEQYQQVLKRSGLYKKIVYISGGVAALGLLTLLYVKLHNNDDHAQGPNISQADKDRVEFDLKKAKLDRFKFWPSIWQAGSAGAAFAIYSIIGSRVTDALSSAGKWAETGFGLFLSNNKTFECERLVGTVGQSIGDIMPEYMLACEHALVLGGNDPVALSFVTFLEHDIIKQQAAFIYAIEHAIAFLSELQLYNGKNKDAEIQVFDEQVCAFVRVLGAYSDALEQMLNEPLGDNKLVLCKKVSLFSQQMYNQSGRFVDGCRRLATEV